MTPEISFKVVTFGQTVKEHYTFIFFQACEWAESSKSCNLVGSESGRYLTILPSNPGGIVGSFIHKFVCCLWMSKNRHFHDDTRDTLCPPPDGGKLSLWRKLWATVNYVTSDGKSLKSSVSLAVVIKSDSRSIGGKDSLATDPLTVFWLVGTIFMGFMELRAGTVGFRVPSLVIFLTVSTTQNFKRR